MNATEEKREATGRCLCGAVHFVARNVPTTYGICHCEMCRRWTGSALLEVSIASDDLVWHGVDHIATCATSDWAERAWCQGCGTGLYFRQTKEGSWFGSTDIPLGIFDNPDGFTLTHEIFVDCKPDSFRYAGEGHKRLTRSDVLLLNPDLDDAQ